MNVEQFKNQNVNWKDKYYSYAIHKTNGGAMYLYQVDGKRLTEESVKNAKVLRLDGISIDKLLYNYNKMVEENKDSEKNL